MAGFQARVSASLQWRLSIVLAAIMVVAVVGAGLFSFWAAFESANALQDDTLREIAAFALRQPAGTAFTRPAVAPASRNEDARVLVAMVGADAADHGAAGHDAPGAAATPALPAGTPDGLATREIGGVAYRVLVQTLADGRRIAIAQQTDLRDDAAQDSALRTVLPMLLLAVVLLLAVGIVVRRLVAPVAAAARALDGRDPHDLRAVDDSSVPAEVQPFVVAMNRMLERLVAVLSTERRFIADAAHALRTPMAAISLQAERLAELPMPPEATQRLATLRQGIARGTTLLDQLLALARARQDRASDPAPAPYRTSTRAVVRRVLADLLDVAHAKGVDIGIVDDADAHLTIDEADLTALIGNLAHNAVHYGDPGGRVDLSVRTDGTRVEIDVVDDGPGIPASERERVFAPFHRGAGQDRPGTGLGLAIVASIVGRAGGTVVLHDRAAEGARGVRARVTLPAST